MRPHLFLPSLILGTVLCFLPTYGTSNAQQGSEETPIKNQSPMVRITDEGLSPSTLRMKKEDNLLFFLNDTTDSLITLSIAFGDHVTHCATSNLKIEGNGTVRSVQPIPPKDFANTCFHDPGTYAFTVFGLKGSPDGVRGSVVIE